MNLYQLDPSHSTASFSIKHMMIARVHGGFEKLKGTLAFDPQNLVTARLDVAIDANSINTRDEQRDAHLKSADFFDVEKYPELTFKSTRMEGKDGEYRILGDLTIHGVTQPVTLEIEGLNEEVKDPWGNIKIGASGKTKIKRKDFGLSWNAALEAGGLLVGDEVMINVEVQFVKSVL